MALPNTVLQEFARHAARAKQAERDRREVIQPVNLVDDAAEAIEAVDPAEALGKRLPGDRFQGCANLRTLRTLMKMVDEKGFERSDHQVRDRSEPTACLTVSLVCRQLQFHSAFERCVSRAIYRGDFEVSRTEVMSINGWQTTPSEVLVSTPRRFGKVPSRTCVGVQCLSIGRVCAQTFAVAIFAAAMALTLGCEIVIFSPARRASRKILERICEFVRLLDFDSRIIEYKCAASLPAIAMVCISTLC